MSKYVLDDLGEPEGLYDKHIPTDEEIESAVASNGDYESSAEIRYVYKSTDESGRHVAEFHDAETGERLTRNWADGIVLREDGTEAEVSDNDLAAAGIPPVSLVDPERFIAEFEGLQPGDVWAVREESEDACS